MSRKRKRRSQVISQSTGILLLELVGVLAFATLLSLVRSEAAMAEAESGARRGATPQVAEERSTRPRISQIVGDIWNAAF